MRKRLESVPKFHPKKVALNWYRYDILFSLELMKGFVENVEGLAQESIKKFTKEKETFDLSEEDYTRVVRVYQGLDDETWDINSIFLEHFPSMQRRSALLTLSGYIEHELDKLCTLYQSEKLYALTLSDLTGKGIDRSASYLEKVAGINMHKQSTEWNEIKAIQKVRNIIVHRNGKLCDYQGNPTKAVIDYIDRTPMLDGDGEIIIHKGFLAHVLNTYGAYFRLIDKSIEAGAR